MTGNKRRNFLLFAGLVLCAALAAGCGKESGEPAMAVTEEAAPEKEEASSGSKTEEDLSAKRQQYESLMRENTALWNTYHAVLQEAAYYDLMEQEELAAETEYRSAEEKLNDTMETTPVHVREPQTFSAEADTEEIPEIPDEELEEWISDLTEQNESIKEELNLLTEKRDILKARYGMTAQ